MDLKGTYEMMYGCRLCGKEFSYISAEYISAMEVVTDFVSGGDGVVREATTSSGTAVTARFWQHQAHICEDGSIGFADFIGFRKGGEECGD